MSTKKVALPGDAGGTHTGASRPLNQRADAQRNRVKILAATSTALHKDPDASVAAIAAEAGVGRMTLYGHFTSRAELIEAALVESLERGEQVLSEVSIDGNAADALSRLVRSSWSLLDRSRGLLAAAQRELPAARIRDLHEASEARMRSLLERGQREGAFRSDLPISWLLATTHVVMNGAAEEISAGRLRLGDAPGFIDATLRAAFAAGTAPVAERHR